MPVTHIVVELTPRKFEVVGEEAAAVVDMLRRVEQDLSRAVSGAGCEAKLEANLLKIFLRGSEADLLELVLDYAWSELPKKHVLELFYDGDKDHYTVIYMRQLKNRHIVITTPQPYDLVTIRAGKHAWDIRRGEACSVHKWVLARVLEVVAAFRALAELVSQL